MDRVEEIKRILKDQAAYLEEKYGVEVIGIFGSYARGEQHSDSDLNILLELEYPPRISLIGLIELEHHLSGILDVKVNTAIKKNFRKRTGQRILNEVISL